MASPDPLSVKYGNGEYAAGNLYRAGNGLMYIKKPDGQYYQVDTQKNSVADMATPNVSGANQFYPNSPTSLPGQNTPAASTVDYSQLLPSAQTYANFAPLSYQQFGDVPYVQASTLTAPHVNQTSPMQAAYHDPNSLPTAGAASVDNSQLPGALQQYSSLVQQQLAPQFQQQNAELTGQLASRGIYNTSAAQELQNQLSGQQASALAQGVSPLVQQFAGAYNQNNQLNAQNQQQANLTNYQGMLAQNQTNQGYQQQANAANYQGGNDYNQLVANLQQQAGLSNQQAYNTANQQNAQAYGAATGANYEAYNNYLQNLMGYQNSTSTGLASGVLNSYNPALSANLLSQGLNQAGNAYNNAFNAGAGNTANLSSTLGNIGSQFGAGIENRSKPGGGADMSNSSFGGW